MRFSAGETFGAALRSQTRLIEQQGHTSTPLAASVMLRFLLLVFIAFRVHAQDVGAVTELDAPGWAPAVEEDLQLAANIDVSKPPKTCRPEIISKIDWGVATAAYQVSLVTCTACPNNSSTPYLQAGYFYWCPERALNNLCPG